MIMACRIMSTTYRQDCPLLTILNSISAKRLFRRQLSDICGGLTRGKVSRELLEGVFGKPLLAMFKACRDPNPRLQFKATRMREGEADSDSILHALCGDETTPGKLQVTLLLCNQLLLPP